MKRTRARIAHAQENGQWLERPVTAGLQAAESIAEAEITRRRNRQQLLHYGLDYFKSK